MPVIAKNSSSHRLIHHETSHYTSNDFGIHYHEHYELYYFVEGDADYMVEGKEYHLTPHSLLLLSPYSFHGVRVNSNAPYTRYYIYFSPEIFPPEQRDLLLSAFPGNKKNSPQEVFYEHTESYQLLTYLEHLAAVQQQPEELLSQYFDIYTSALLARINLMSQALHPSPVTNKAPENIRKVLKYLNEHLTDNITLDELAGRFYISKHYLNRAFKKATGTTVIDYLISKRTIRARQLMHNGLNATDACMQCGFSDYSVFYRAYKKTFGHSPSKDTKIRMTP